MISFFKYFIIVWLSLIGFLQCQNSQPIESEENKNTQHNINIAKIITQEIKPIKKIKAKGKSLTSFNSINIINADNKIQDITILGIMVYWDSAWIEKFTDQATINEIDRILIQFRYLIKDKPLMITEFNTGFRVRFEDNMDLTHWLLSRGMGICDYRLPIELRVKDCDYMKLAQKKRMGIWSNPKSLEWFDKFIKKP